MSGAASSEPKLAMIVAVGRNGAIGRGGDLPWRLSSDLKMFRRLTMGKPLIMGRKTFLSLPGGPLDGRDNIIVSATMDAAPEGSEVYGDVMAALARARERALERGVDEVMLIGGAELFAALLDEVDRIYWTAVDAEPEEADTFIDPLDTAQWALVRREPINRGPRDEYASELLIYERAGRSA